MIDKDKRYRIDGRKARVIHVPLTDAEWNNLQRRGFEERRTLGDMTSTALQRTYKLGVTS